MDKILTDKEQIILDKLTMLFVIDKMEIPLTEDSILDICSVKNNWIENYMDCKAIIHDLVSSHLLYKIGNEEEGKELFALTYEGRECLSHLYKRLPFEMREEISQYLQANRLNKNIQPLMSKMKMGLTQLFCRYTSLFAQSLCLNLKSKHLLAKVQTRQFKNGELKHQTYMKPSL